VASAGCITSQDLTALSSVCFFQTEIDYSKWSGRS
jgi:hypothetical protein